MTFTALESTLLAAVVSVVVGFIVRARSVTPAACGERRQVDAEWRAKQDALLVEIKLTNEIQFRMLQSIVLALDIPREEQQKILNMGADKK